MIDRTYQISDVVSEDFLRFPLSLLANPKYKAMSLEAKFIYSLLLNRLTLSQKNGWVNEDNEVYLIYTREEAANTLNISYKKAISAFKELIKAKLLCEQRQGRGYPNLLYVLKAELSDKNAEKFSDNFNEISNETDNIQAGISRPAETAVQDMQNENILKSVNSTSRNAREICQELSETHTIKNNNINNKNSQIENSQSVSPTEKADSEMLEDIFEHCELYIFRENIQTMFKSVIERLFYTKTLKVGNAVLPQESVRSYLKLLDSDVLIGALNKMKENGDKVVNSTAYLMSVIFNGICEKDSKHILSFPSDFFSESDFYAAPKSF